MAATEKAFLDRKFGSAHLAKLVTGRVRVGSVSFNREHSPNVILFTAG